MHILQLLVWECFPELRPAMAMASASESADDGGVPRASQWHSVHKALDLGFAHAVFMASKEFEWRPYGSSYWVCSHGVRGGDAAGARALLSFARRLVAGGGVGGIRWAAVSQASEELRDTRKVERLPQSFSVRCVGI
jgi:hypothetical protein